MAGPSDQTAQHFVGMIRTDALHIANQRARQYLSQYSDGRAQIAEVFGELPWGSDRSPFSFEIRHEQSLLLTEDDKKELRRILRESVVQALADTPDNIGGLIVGYARQGKNFFDEFQS